MDMMDQYLLSLGLDSSPSILLSKIFLLVFAVLLFNFLVRKLFSQFAVKLQKTENEQTLVKNKNYAIFGNIFILLRVIIDNILSKLNLR